MTLDRQIGCLLPTLEKGERLDIAEFLEMSADRSGGDDAVWDRLLVSIALASRLTLRSA